MCIFCFLILKIYFMYMNVLPTSMYVCHMYAWCPRSEEGTKSPGIGITDGHEPSYRC